jgi:LysR family glycine cleavage system transcriptional activator
VRISSSFGEIDFQRDDLDVAILFGQGKYPGLKAVKLFEESVSPMYNPRSHPRSFEGESHAPLQNIEDLSNHVLLHNDSLSKFEPAFPNWASWLKSAGAEHVNTLRGPRFSQPDHALQAAIDGAGVVLGWCCLAANDIAAGRLEQPFNLALPLGLAFHLVYPEAYGNRPEITAFRDWLMEEP